MSKGDIVKYKNPYADEVGSLYRVVEVNGDRVIMEALIGLPIAPALIANINDIELA